MMHRIARSALYWLAVIATGLSMEGVALYYQYGLDYGPCVLCSHIRAWILGIVLVAFVGLLVRRRTALNAGAHLVMLVLAAGLTWSSYQTLGIERGWFEGSCEFSAGYPGWFPLHEWAPAIFEPWELCGYTPELLFGVTMAEALMGVSVLALVAFVVGGIAVLRSGNTAD